MYNDRSISPFDGFQVELQTLFQVVSNEDVFPETPNPDLVPDNY